jgi:hypothetical protein
MILLIESKAGEAFGFKIPKGIDENRDSQIVDALNSLPGWQPANIRLALAFPRLSKLVLYGFRLRFSSDYDTRSELIPHAF